MSASGSVTPQRHRSSASLSSQQHPQPSSSAAAAAAASTKSPSKSPKNDAQSRVSAELAIARQLKLQKELNEMIAIAQAQNFQSKREAGGGVIPPPLLSSSSATSLLSRSSSGAGKSSARRSASMSRSKVLPGSRSAQSITSASSKQQQVSNGGGNGYSDMYRSDSRAHTSSSSSSSSKKVPPLNTAGLLSHNNQRRSASGVVTPRGGVPKSPSPIVSPLSPKTSTPRAGQSGSHTPKAGRPKPNLSARGPPAGPKVSPRSANISSPSPRSTPHHAIHRSQSSQNVSVTRAAAFISSTTASSVPAKSSITSPPTQSTFVAAAASSTSLPVLSSLPSSTESVGPDISFASPSRRASISLSQTSRSQISPPLQSSFSVDHDGSPPLPTTNHSPSILASAVASSNSPPIPILSPNSNNSPSKSDYVREVSSLSLPAVMPSASTTNAFSSDATTEAVISTYTTPVLDSSNSQSQKTETMTGLTLLSRSKDGASTPSVSGRSISGNMPSSLRLDVPVMSAADLETISLPDDEIDSPLVHVTTTSGDLDDYAVIDGDGVHFVPPPDRASPLLPSVVVELSAASDHRATSISVGGDASAGDLLPQEQIDEDSLATTRKLVSDSRAIASSPLTSPPRSGSLHNPLTEAENDDTATNLPPRLESNGDTLLVTSRHPADISDIVGSPSPAAAPSESSQAFQVASVVHGKAASTPQNVVYSLFKPVAETETTPDQPVEQSYSPTHQQQQQQPPPPSQQQSYTPQLDRTQSLSPTQSDHNAVAESVESKSNTLNRASLFVPITPRSGHATALHSKRGSLESSDTGMMSPRMGSTSRRLPKLSRENSSSSLAPRSGHGTLRGASNTGNSSSTTAGTPSRMRQRSLSMANVNAGATALRSTYAFTANNVSGGGGAEGGGLGIPVQDASLQEQDDSGVAYQRNIHVTIRFRPISELERAQHDWSIVEVQGKNVILHDPNEESEEFLKNNPLYRSRKCKFHFDSAFDGSAAQLDVYQSSAQPMIADVIAGVNGTVFCYGATGSGKTYTMSGNAAHPGIMPQMVADLFSKLEHQFSPDQFDVSAFYLEIYNERLRDLLTPDTDQITMREDPRGGCLLKGVTIRPIASLEDILLMLEHGSKNRSVDSHRLNEASSRSHAVLQIIVRVLPTGKSAKLTLCDLAGSERTMKNTGLENKKLRREGSEINKSLLALSNCINALSSKNKRGLFVPFRASKLTRLLKDSLTGFSKTSMIANVSAASSQFIETRETLVYANRAANIKAKVLMEEPLMDVGYYKAMVDALKRELDEMRRSGSSMALQTSKAERDDVQALTMHLPYGGSLGGFATLPTPMSPNQEKQEKLWSDHMRGEITNCTQKQIQAKRSLAELHATDVVNKARISQLNAEIERLQGNYNVIPSLLEQYAESLSASSLSNFHFSNELFQPGGMFSAIPRDLRDVIREKKALIDGMKDNYEYLVALQSRLEELRQKREHLRTSISEMRSVHPASDERRDLLQLELRHGDLQLSNVEMEMQLNLLRRMFEMNQKIGSAGLSSDAAGSAPMLSRGGLPNFSSGSPSERSLHSPHSGPANARIARVGSFDSSLRDASQNPSSPLMPVLHEHPSSDTQRTHRLTSAESSSQMSATSISSTINASSSSSTSFSSPSASSSFRSRRALASNLASNVIPEVDSSSSADISMLETDDKDPLLAEIRAAESRLDAARRPKPLDLPTSHTKAAAFGDVAKTPLSDEIKNLSVQSNPSSVIPVSSRPTIKPVPAPQKQSPSPSLTDAPPPPPESPPSITDSRGPTPPPPPPEDFSQEDVPSLLSGPAITHDSTALVVTPRAGKPGVSPTSNESQSVNTSGSLSSPNSSSLSLVPSQKSAFTKVGTPRGRVSDQSSSDSETPTATWRSADLARKSATGAASQISRLSVDSYLPAGSNIIVVGAGMAGLAAARALQDERYNVIVLEARTRIGGRIHTQNGLDLGAHSIYGVDRQPLNELCDRFKLPVVELGGNSSIKGGVKRLRLFVEGEGWLSDIERDSVYTTFSEAFNAVHEAEALARSGGMLDDSAWSLRAAFENVLKSEFSTLTRGEQDKLRWFLHCECSGDYGEDAERLSWWRHDAGLEVFSGEDVVLASGMADLIEAQAVELDIRRPQVVKRIEYNTLGVKVQTDSGDVFEADACIVTLPLGVLKQNSLQFEPPLPAAKVEAISRLGFGLINKIFLRFETAFWPTQTYCFGYVSEHTQSEVMPEILLNLSLTHNVPVLMCVVGGDAARRTEARSDAENTVWVMQLVRRLFGKDSPEPIETVVTRWERDPFSRGAALCMTKGSRGESDIITLSEPLMHRVLFAGEATSEVYWGTVHGAYISGLREAARISQKFSLLPRISARTTRRVSRHKTAHVGEAWKGRPSSSKDLESKTQALSPRAVSAPLDKVEKARRVLGSLLNTPRTAAVSAAADPSSDREVSISVESPTT